jgi:hypothetical protein
MRLLAVVAFALAVVSFGATPGAAVEQNIVALTPPDEQRIEVITPADDQQGVDAVDDAATQTVAAHEPPSPSAKAASTAGKFVLGVASAGLALGVMAASLLLL